MNFPKLCDAIKRARRAGAVVTVPRRTGEYLFTHPHLPDRVRVNNRRKDANAKLVVFLRKVELWHNERTCNAR